MFSGLMLRVSWYVMFPLYSVIMLREKGKVKKRGYKKREENTQKNTHASEIFIYPNILYYTWWSAWRGLKKNGKLRGM